MSDFTKIGTSMLNMEDIADYLTLAKGFSLKTDKANDTLNVGGKAASTIAVSAIGDSGADKYDQGTNMLYYISPGDYQKNKLKDRSTVKNALFLDGRRPDYYATASALNSANTHTKSLTDDYNVELSDLRDELYQLRAELASNGFVAHQSPYTGFYDAFDHDYPMHLNGRVTIPVADSASRSVVQVSDSYFEDTAVCDWLVIVDMSDVGQDAEDITNQPSSLVQVMKKRDDHRTLEISPGAGFDVRKSTSVIYRVAGTAINGEFVFGTIQSAHASDDTEKMWTGLDDDTYPEIRQIDVDNPGYAYTFRIPKNMQGNYLAGLEVMIHAHGKPAALVCKIIRESDITTYNERRAAEIEGQPLTEKVNGKTNNVYADDLIIAKSRPLTVDGNLGLHLETFNFYTSGQAQNAGYNLTSDMAYPLLSDKDTETKRARYCFIIEPVSLLSVNNYYDIEFIVSSKQGDLQTNNRILRFNNDIANALTEDEAMSRSMDFYYGVCMVKAVASKFTPLDAGLYVAQFKEPIQRLATRARLTLRVRREGMYHLTNGGSYSPNSSLTIVSEDPAYTADFTNRHDGYLVIGSNLVGISSANDAGHVVTKDGFNCEANAPVYPLGYDVQLKAKYVTWDSVRNIMVEQYSQVFKMNPVIVMPDSYQADKQISNRIIFETDLLNNDRTLRPFNQFEVQIHWTKSCTNNKKPDTSRADGVSRYPLAGGIHSLALSLDHIV